MPEPFFVTKLLMSYTEEMTGLCLSANEATEPALSSKLILSKIPFSATK